MWCNVVFRVVNEVNIHNIHNLAWANMAGLVTFSSSWFTVARDLYFLDVDDATSSHFKMYSALWLLFEMKVCLLFGPALKGYIGSNQAEHDNDLHIILASFFYLWIFCNGSFLCSCTCCLNTTVMLVTLGNINGSICKSDLYIWILHVNEETRCLRVLNSHFWRRNSHHKQKGNDRKLVGRRIMLQKSLTGNCFAKEVH